MDSLHRLRELDLKPLNEEETFKAQMIIVMDECVAAIMRSNKSLRDEGFTAIADEIEKLKDSECL